VKSPFQTLLVSVLVCLLIVPIALGGKVDTNGKWALQFGLQSDVRLTGFNNSSLALQKTTKGGSTWRLGLDFGISTRSQDQSQTTPDTVRAGTSRDDDTESATVVLQKLFRLHTSTPIRPYIAIGPLVGFRHTNNTLDPAQSTTKRENIDNMWMVGARGAVGAEWFVTDYLSLLAEYAGDVSVRWDKSTSKSTYYSADKELVTKEEVKNTYFSLSSGVATLAVSLYF